MKTIAIVVTGNKQRRARAYSPDAPRVVTKGYRATNYAVTHVASGRSVWHFEKLATARRACIELLAHEGFEGWQRETEALMSDPGLAMRVRITCNAYDGAS